MAELDRHPPGRRARVRTLMAFDDFCLLETLKMLIVPELENPELIKIHLFSNHIFKDTDMLRSTDPKLVDGLLYH